MCQKSRYWVRLARLTILALGVGLAGGLIGYTLLGSFLYTQALTHPNCAETGATPADVGIKGAREAAYSSHDGLMLQAWYLPPQNGAVIILLPGLGGAREGMLREGTILARHGYGLLMTELRSCAHAERQTTLGYREAKDLMEAVTWVRSQPSVARVGLLGYSLGGVTAILGTAQDERIDAVVAEGGFYDLAADITNEGGVNSLWNSLTYQSVLFFFHRETGVDAHDVSPISVIDRISPRPLLLIYGEQETDARPWEQFARAEDPKSLWILPDCRHGDYLNVAPDEWERRVVAFFDDILPPEN